MRGIQYTAAFRPGTIVCGSRMGICARLARATAGSRARRFVTAGVPIINHIRRRIERGPEMSALSP